MFDDLFLGSRLDDPEELLLPHERALLQTLALHNDVGETDEATRDHPQRPERDEHMREAGSRECSTVGVLHRVGLRHSLGKHEEDDDVQHHTDSDTRGAEETAGHDARQGRLHGL